VSKSVAQDLRDAHSEDLDEVLALNEKALPHVSSVALEDMMRFLEQAAYFKIIGGYKGFLIALRLGLDYASDNYHWLSNNFDDFLYIDRIVIAEDARRQGLGSQLYKDVIETSRNFSQRLTCEVNSRPPNPESMVFHKVFGFKCVGTLQTEDGMKKVKLLSLDLNPLN
jgi:predicted GNAT superfamily acetyltransferase